MSARTGAPPIQTIASRDLALPRVESWTLPVSCKWNIVWPLPDTPMPVIDHERIPQHNLFRRPTTVGNSVIVYNYCRYDLWVRPHVGNNVNAVERIPSQRSKRFDIEKRDLAVNLKVSKIESNFAKPVQIEYAVANGALWYDLSLIDCLGTTGEARDGKPVRNGDTSACAGHEAGLQLGNANDMTFQCGPGAWCDDQAYLYEENLCKSQNPVSACSPSDGLGVEFCASMKA
ncbi:hypothetical protein GQ44DRAFT_638310 [Phaeosphaeriaceae sp. PMI808]|nr:hypothetical protein GQ44DRAFT_638310 [Phaeosphaeriaceae sp. PMI808]